jgi:hypothetical protein
MKTRNLIFSACFILLFFLPQNECFSQIDPGIPDTVSFGEPVIHLTGPPYQGTMLLPIYVFNDEVLAQVDIPFKWTGPISCDSGELVRELAPNSVQEYFSFNNQERWVVESVVVTWTDEPTWIPPGQGGFHNIYFSIQDTGYVSIDTLSMFGFLRLRMVDTLGMVIIPHFTSLQIHIQPLLPGDVNKDGQVDIGDIIFLINYLFKHSIAPEPIESGDVNGDCEVDVGDVVYLVNYFFKNGPVPQSEC